MKHSDPLNLPKKMKITDPDEIHVMQMYRQFNGDLIGFSLNNVVSFSFLEWKKIHYSKVIGYDFFTEDPMGKPFSARITVEFVENPSHSGNLN